MNTSHAAPDSRRLAWAALAVLAVVVGTGWSTDARANGPQLQTLMQRNNCTACHLIDKRKYGPNFKEVAARYAADAGAITTLAAKIRAGGSGVWGEDMMPPQPSVSEADARTMADLILSLKPD